MEEENEEKVREKEPAKKCQQGIFVTETTLANPNGSFNDNRPRFDIDKIYTTDKCIKYNVRDYIHRFIQGDGLDLFYIKRKSDEADQFTNDFKSKEEVIKEIKKKQDDFRKAFVQNHIDVRLFGSTLAVDDKDTHTKITGPVQLSYGIDLLGAQIKEAQIGTPFSTEDDDGDGGGQTTLGKDKLVDHAMIAYDITVNPKNAVHSETGDSILKVEDLEYLKEGLVFGTNMRKTTSKNTNSKLLLMVTFDEGNHLNIGELKRLVEVKSKKFNKSEDISSTPKFDLTKLYQKLAPYIDKIETIKLYTDSDVDTKTDWDEKISPLKEKIEEEDFAELIN